MAVQAAGLAQRRVSPTDRRARAVALTLTPEGRRILREADAVLDRINESVLQALPQRDRKQFIASLRRFVSERLRQPAVCRATVRGAL